MSIELQWLDHQRGSRDEPEWAWHPLMPRCPTELVVTSSRGHTYRKACETWKGQTLYRECTIGLAAEWHWITKEEMR